jgi:small-conductance mechanosensitive channel
VTRDSGLESPFEVDVSETLALSIGALALVLAGLGRFARFQVLRSLRGALALLGVAALAQWGSLVLHAGGRWQEWAGVVVLLALGYLLARLALLVVFEWLLLQRVGIPVPRLARDLVALLLYVAVAAAVLRASLGIEVKALLATSAVLTVVIGLALQETLGSLLAGLALAWEKQVATGEWIEADGVVGRVEELGWRSVAMRTRLGERIVIPNSRVARERLRVLGHGAEPVAVPVRVGVAYDAAPFAVREVLRRAAQDCPGVVDTPAPQVLTSEFADSAVVYECRLWTNEPWRDSDVRDAFLTRAHAALGRAGMEIPFPQRTVRVLPPAPARAHGVEAAAALAACELFAGLPDDGLASLAGDSRSLLFAPGEAVVREGESSGALFVIAAGEAAVVKGADEIARIGRGGVFGEMAFLSGAPRAATVRAIGALEVVEVDGRALGALLREHVELAEELARRMAERQQDLAAREQAGNGSAGPRGLVGYLRERLLGLVRA